ncbi:hypothetical protein SAMN02949497_2640 [Methylomagnum ishizawai]|uniref:PIN-like domain-containing protein n=1 Tax=Methylomagnum ishizawai TaxID=1760988 RepID=A0A1Y6CY47_9GAMM|nr:PIN domain-containing protein [Methylomagnum ishizawai]SMF95281.1 hypothetical protein SAMN02949497_2640 [Methylomagnum ishizawai]
MSEAVLPVQKVLLVDLENCPGQIKQLQGDMEAFSRVVICYANGVPRIPLDWLVPLAKAVNADRLRVVKMQNGGKNAADFGISFFAGMLMQELPADTHFVIVSNDTDLDHAVNLLISQGRTAERVGKAVEPTEEKEQGIAAHETSNPIGVYCAHLLAHPKTRPAKETTLRSSIKAKFGGDEKMADEVLKSLLSFAAVKIEQGGLTYNDMTLQALSWPSKG